MSTRKLTTMNVFLASRDALKRVVLVYAHPSPVKAQGPFGAYLSVLASGTRSRLSVEASSSRLALASKLRPLFGRFNTWLTVLSSLFARQCHAIAAQRVRRAAQIIALYGNLGYDRRSLQTAICRVGGAFLRRIGDRPRHLLWGLAIFAWDRETISDEEISRCLFAERVPYRSTDIALRLTLCLDNRKRRHRYCVVSNVCVQTFYYV